MTVPEAAGVGAVPPPPPPSLPIDRPVPALRFVRIAIVGVAQAIAFVAIESVLDGLRIDGIGSALALVVVLSLLNAFVWPIVIRVALPVILMTVGLFTFVVNALFVWLATTIVDGIELSSWWAALIVGFVAAVVNLTVGGALEVDDDHIWRAKVARRALERSDEVDRTDVPGFLFVQIDGLGHQVVTDAMSTGHAPFLSRLVETGTHRLHGWECDLSSQTGAMQAGILLGDNHNMPAFRWYEKETGRVMVTNRPVDAAELERRQSAGIGLLAGGGASRANVFSGDTDDSLFTFSSLGNKTPARQRIMWVVSTPYALFRIVALMVVDIVREKRAYRQAKKAGAQPLGHRGGVYPLLRAATAVGLAEVTWAMLVADLARGVPTAYVDLVGYDEVAHHSGIEAPDALDTLARIDDALERVLTTLDSAPRPYHLVVLSDHGQTEGATFLQRYGETLDSVVGRLANEAVTAPVLAEEGWNNLNGLLTEAASDPSPLGRMVKQATNTRTVDGDVVIGPDAERTISVDAGELIVLASGNLGLVSFPQIEGRASRQAIESAHPGLLDGLVKHPGVGFVLVRDVIEGDLVLGVDGVHHLDRTADVVTGVDPLAPFGPNAAEHLRRTSSFDNCPDLLVNSFYDSATFEGAAFEELIGFHGGLGGRQSSPFVLAPAGLEQPSVPLVGARSIHDMFSTWIADTHGRPSVR
jgi:uncharacterized membrane protein YvlD (DUF360 family)